MVKLKSRSEVRTNIRLAGVILLGAFCIIAGRAYCLQVFQSAELVKRIENQTTSRIVLTPRRGSLVDRNGREMAVSISVESLYARPHHIVDKESAARRLAPITGLPAADILAKLSGGRNFVWIRRHMPPAQAATVRQLDIPGIGFVDENKRFYPNKELAGQLIGFTGVDTQGLGGLEYQFDAILRGAAKELVASRDALGRSLFAEGIQISTDGRQGHDLVLTIDTNIQYIVEKELQAAVTLSGARAGTALIMDPWTGEILALANVPLFDPNSYERFSLETHRNRAITDIFEPGSTFKPFLIAAALEEGLIKPHDIFFCENGVYRVSNKNIHDVHPHGWLNVTNILKYSSNIGVSKIAKHLGRDLFYQYIRKFGFGQETGIPLPVEAAGSVPPPFRCSEHTQSAMAFGQAISVTPLQLATAYCALANGGRLVRPHVVKRIVDLHGGIVEETQPAVLHRVISDATCRTVNTMLQSAVQPDGTGTKAAVDGFSVAGKTGTSQKIVPNQKGYCTKRFIASFAGFAPASRPRITVLVIIDEPQTMTYGGQIAAPAFSRITQLVLNYLQVPPEHTGGDAAAPWQPATFQPAPDGILDEA
jgi:cell division protein FtsI (penicillin-binding protein 3)